MEKVKRICYVLVLVTILILQPVSVFAQETGNIILNGQEIKGTSYEEEGNLYLPIRVIAEALGYTVNWSGKNQTVTLKSDTDTILLDFAKLTVDANDHDYYMQDRKIFVNGRSYMNENFFSDELGLAIKKDDQSGLVHADSVKENDITIQNIKEVSETDILKLNLQYPQISGLKNQEVQEGINKLFKDAAMSAKVEGEKNAASLEEYLKEFKDGPPNKSETYFNYKVKYNQNNLLSIVLQDYQFAGGAHGGTIQSAYTIDLNTGKQYALKDLFKEGSDYVKVISDEVKKQLEKRGLTEVLFEPFNKINENQGFFLSNDGVTVFFQQYEILPYAAGIQEFTVGYDQLKDIEIVP